MSGEVVRLERYRSAPPTTSTTLDASALSSPRSTGPCRTRSSALQRRVLHSVGALDDPQLVLKRRVRSGIREHERGFVWHVFACGGASEDEQLAAYADMLSDAFGGVAVRKDGQQGELPEPPALAEVPSFGGKLHEAGWADEHALSADKLLVVRRVLCAIAFATGRDDCPPLCDACAMLSHELDEPLVFSALVALLERGDMLEPRRGWDQAFDASTTASTRARACSLRHAFAELASMRCKPTAAHLEAIGAELPELVRPWFDRLFVGSLPYATALRVLDSFLAEGGKVRAQPAARVRRAAADRPAGLGAHRASPRSGRAWARAHAPQVLFRVGIALLKRHHKSLCACSTPEQAHAALHMGANSEHDARPLMARAFALRNFKHATILELQRRKLEQLGVAMGPAGLARGASAFFVPRLLGGAQSTLLAALGVETRRQLWLLLPAAERTRDGALAFNNVTHGSSLRTLYDKSAAAVASSAATGGVRPQGELLLVRTLDGGAVFGAFASHGWRRSGGEPYGCGECFLLTLLPQVRRFGWSKRNTIFACCDHASVSMGGGAHGGYGLWLDADLDHGRSSACETFDSEPLAGSATEFRCAEVEVWAFA